MAPSAGPPADAVVIYGATGDLAAKMIFPALACLRQRDGLDLPVVAVGRTPLAHGALAARLRQAVAQRAPALAAPFDALAARLTYISGDLADRAVYDAIRRTLGNARCAVHYLAVPPALFVPVIRGLAESGLARRARIAIEKPFGRDLASAQALERVVESVFAEDEVFRIDHYLAKDPVRNVAAMRASCAWLDPLWSHRHVRSVQVTMSETFGIGTRGAFYEATGALRDVFQNHLLQLVAIVAMEPVPLDDADAFSAARVEALRAIRPIAPQNAVYGQYAGYRAERDVDPRSEVATYLAVRLDVDTPRFAGVPFYVRAGKRMPVTTTLLSLSLLDRGAPRADARIEVVPGMPGDVALRDDAARAAARTEGAVTERLRFRLGPGAVRVAVDTERLRYGSAEAQVPLTLAGELPHDEDRDAYANILRALVRDERAFCERAAGVMAAWRAVEPLLHDPPPVHPYADGTFGPAEADRLLCGAERWLDPTPA